MLDLEREKFRRRHQIGHRKLAHEKPFGWRGARGVGQFFYRPGGWLNHGDGRGGRNITVNFAASRLWLARMRPHSIHAVITRASPVIFEINVATLGRHGKHEYVWRQYDECGRLSRARGWHGSLLR